MKTIITIILLLPCEECRDDALGFLDDYSGDLDTVIWSLHNSVNIKLGKAAVPRCSLDRASLDPIRLFAVLRWLALNMSPNLWTTIRWMELWDSLTKLPEIAETPYAEQMAELKGISERLEFLKQHTHDFMHQMVKDILEIKE